MKTYTVLSIKSAPISVVGFRAACAAARALQMELQAAWGVSVVDETGRELYVAR